jgi:quercetin dioxygenase-like cupin family protein
MLKFHKLALNFDAAALESDVKNFSGDDWTPHFNTQYYEGDWSGIALRAVKNAHVELYPDPVASDGYVDTAMLERCPCAKKVLSVFECELETARFLRLSAGSTIREHRDHKLGYEDGIVRIHIPIVTHPLVDFTLGGERVTMLPGEAWYLNFNLPHSVKNDSKIDRVHLVVDCVLNDWLRGFFPAS